MLVLSRRVGEEVVIAGNVRVIVLTVQGHDRIRVGVAAPPEVGVYRQELLGEHAEPSRPTSATRGESDR